MHVFLEGVKSVEYIVFLYVCDFVSFPAGHFIVVFSVIVKV